MKPTCVIPLCALALAARTLAQNGGAPPAAAALNAAAPELARFTVRDGYQVSVAVANLPSARFLEIDDRGTLYVSRPDRGDIIALRDADGDGVYETRAEFITGKATVHGMCFVPDKSGANAPGWLWFSTSGSIHRARDTDGDLKADEVIDVIAPGSLPRGGAHWWRSLLVTADSIYTSIGDGGNISDLSATEREKIWRFDLDGSNKRLFAAGLRNTEKLRLRPGTQEVWGLDHGSDWFGQRVGDKEGDQPVTDLNPPDELNRYTEGGFYGHPFVVGNRVPRYEYLDRPDIHELAARTIAPEWCVHAHWATNGFTWIDPEVNRKTGGLPADHSGDLFIACHGSWNSTDRVGYCIARVLFDQGHPYGLLKIVGTLDPGNQAILARPVDCVQAPDGSILFSSDQPGRVYRIRYVGRKS